MVTSKLKEKIKDLTLVAFDTETTGPYPVKDDIVEFGAVKWRDGQEVGRLEFLFKPKFPMTEFNISIHGITNEMVADKGKISESISEIRDFFTDSIGIAHHAPFDLGFVTFDLEKNYLSLPQDPVLCTSLISRKVIYGVENHKLQTLIKHFQFPSLAAHRAYEDARACMFVFHECLKKIDSDVTLEELIALQGKKLNWHNYSLFPSKSPVLNTLIKSIEQQHTVELVYGRGNKKNQPRTLQPLGIVRSPDGDYLQAFDPVENRAKRFLLEFIIDVGN
ncbi:MAG: WYL domain-containing protein [Bdellovibrionaceae bacterium]|nr:WYL domain-containing protein [Pseudobdellovibrionaceae bacterium]